MKVKYLKLKSWLLVTVMGALGLSSCHCQKKMAQPSNDDNAIQERDEIRLMYGVPTMDYMIRGQVRDADGKPVQNIRLNMLEPGIEATADEVKGDPVNVQKYLESTSVATDSKGRYELKNSGLPQDQVRLLVRDVDGERNGNFANQLIEIEVDAESMNKKNASGWYVGEFDKKLDIKLDRK